MKRPLLSSSAFLQQVAVSTCSFSPWAWWQMIQLHLPPAASHLRPVVFKLSLSADAAVPADNAMEQGEDVDPLLDAELDRVELQMTARKGSGTPAAASPGLCSAGGFCLVLQLKPVVLAASASDSGPQPCC